MPSIPLSQSSTRTVVSALQFEDQSDFKASISDTLLEAQGFHDLVITDLPRGWALFLWELEENNNYPHPRKSYDPFRHTLRLTIMPTPVHDCACGWLSQAHTEWSLAGLLNREERRLLRIGSKASKL